MQQLQLQVGETVADQILNGGFVVDDDRVFAIVENEEDLSAVSGKENDRID